MKNDFPRVGDRYRFEYPTEPQFNCILEVVKVHNGLAFFDDGTHSKAEFLRTKVPVNEEAK